MPTIPLDRLRQLCRALPETHEVIAWGEPTFRVRNKLFAMYAGADSHHGGGRPAVWIKALKENQSFIIQAAPGRFFSPPYVGPGGWVGAWLDRRPPWQAIAQLIEDGYRLTAPKRLLTAKPGAPQAAPAAARTRKVRLKGSARR